MKIIIDNKIPFIKGVLEPFAEVLYLKGSEINNKDLTDADALIIRTRTKVNKELLRGTRVRFVGTATIGTDHIDTVWCENNAVKWTHAPGCNSGSVMQYIISAVLFLANKYNLLLKDMTMGVIGVGNVGSKVAKACEILGMTVLRNDPPRERTEGSAAFSSIDYLISNSDIISLHVPLTVSGIDKTYHLTDDDFFKRMKKKSFIINTSRGSVINEKSLINNINSNHIRAAVLDVWENEPDISNDLLGLADIGTAHIAGYSLDGKANGSSMIINQLAMHFDLPLKNWRPDGIPEAIKPIINIDAKNGSEADIIRESVLRTYPVEDDSNLLKNSPGNFEELRGNYRNRREFQAYTIHGNSTAIVKLKQLGFKK